MNWLLTCLTYLLTAIVGGLAGVAIYIRHRNSRRNLLAWRLDAHFASAGGVQDLQIVERQFPIHLRPDLQRAIDGLFSKDSVRHFCGVKTDYPFGPTFSSIFAGEVTETPAEYADVDIGEERPVRCVDRGLWLLQHGDAPAALLLTPACASFEVVGVSFHVASPAGQNTDWIFKRLEETVQSAQSYRGKILSLEKQQSVFGTSAGVTVHRLRTVVRDEVILPQTTLDLLERNVIQFAARRARLSDFGQSVKKGLLFYGPPGTGKTHTIHYLAHALQGHTTLLITAEQMALLSQHMSIARLLQPSVVVIEDVDLMARDRTQMNSPCEESLLNKLLNEMDGLKQDAAVLFILTTNRPETLEGALASRPGRVDQAIEFPLPDDEGRRKLVRLYSRSMNLSDDVVEAIVRRTHLVSAAFIKELMRRSIQFHLERSDNGCISLEDVENALQEMVFAGGAWNLKLLGANIEMAVADDRSLPKEPR